MTVGELPTQSPYNIKSANQDGGLKNAAAVAGGNYAGRIVVAGDGKDVHFGGGLHHTNISPGIASYIWKRTT